MTWAIKNKRTGKYVYGTDYDRNGPPIQLTSFQKALLFDDERECLHAMRHRRCGGDYGAVEVYLCEHAGKGFCGL